MSRPIRLRTLPGGGYQPRAPTSEPRFPIGGTGVTSPGNRPGRKPRGPQPHQALVKAALEWLRWRVRDGWWWENKTVAVFDPEKQVWRAGGVEPGAADILGCWRGLHIELEAKVGKDRLSPPQRQHAARIEAAGGVHRVFRSIEDVERIVAEIEPAPRPVHGVRQGLDHA